jgi:aminopeptidase I
MTRHTAEFLRARSSNLSLRPASLEPSMHLRAVPVYPVVDRPAPIEQSTESRLFVIAGMEGRPERENPVCVFCATRLQAEQRRHIIAADQESCKICAYKAVRPGAFTKPFCDFLTENPTVFHAVDDFKSRLTAVDYVEVSFGDG